jgi:hypothetical protein
MYGVFIRFWPTLLICIAESLSKQNKRLPPDVTRVGQNRIYTPYMTVCMVISLPKILYIHRIYRVGQNRIYTPYMTRVGQNPIYMVHIRYIWQGNHQIYGHIRCVYTVLANPIYDRMYGDFPAKNTVYTPYI